MAESGLFIGWGDIRTGRDAAANKVFAEALAYWPTLQAAGEIESVEIVILGLTAATWAASSCCAGTRRSWGG